MSDEQGKDSPTAAAEPKPNGSPKTWADAEVQEIIKERQDAKKKAREAEEARVAAEADAKAKAERAKELEGRLTESTKIVEGKEASEKELRSEFLSRIKDEAVRKSLESEPLSLKALMLLAEKTAQAGSPDASRGAAPKATEVDFRDAVKPKPNENPAAYMERIAKLRSKAASG